MRAGVNTYLEQNSLGCGGWRDEGRARPLDHRGTRFSRLGEGIANDVGGGILEALLVLRFDPITPLCGEARVAPGEELLDQRRAGYSSRPERQLHG
jgi:hypothetical protein